MKQTLTVFCIDWQLIGKSAEDLISTPLKPYLDVTYKTWNPDRRTGDFDYSANTKFWFHQFLPSFDVLRKLSHPIIWTPMWDEVRDRPQTWWKHLPKSLRVVAFSKAVAQRARQAGLPVFEVQYFKNPADFIPAKWGEKHTLFYWNRRGMISPEFLERFCTELKIERLLFRADIDPYVDERAKYMLPARIGNTMVETIEATASRDAYWKLIEPANIVIAPRLHEGAGMVFLEQMARGCAVFANNAPTMNEYIEHRINGVLFQRGWTLTRARNAILWRLAQRNFSVNAPFTFLLPERQNWNEIASLDLKKLGETAREQHIAGYGDWQASIPQYVHFIQGN